jgi:hypothetical protein
VTREELEHVIRAAADVANAQPIVVVGSQAILGRFPDAPAPLLMSREADVYPRDDPARAVEIDGAIGDGSPFHETYGYYAHGVGPETPKAPAGWQERLVPVVVPVRGRGEIRGLCMEPHDLVLSKCVAGRERDLTFVEVALRHDLVDAEELLRRTPDLPLSTTEQRRVERSIHGIIVRSRPR